MSRRLLKNLLDEPVADRPRQFDVPSLDPESTTTISTGTVCRLTSFRQVTIVDALSFVRTMALVDRGVIPSSGAERVQVTESTHTHISLPDVQVGQRARSFA